MLARGGAKRFGRALSLAGHIVMAWVLTIPATALIAAVFYGLRRPIVRAERELIACRQARDAGLDIAGSGVCAT